MLWSDAGHGRAQSRVVTHLDVSGADVAPVAGALRALVS
jgi:hypothetical protein